MVFFNRIPFYRQVAKLFERPSYVSNQIKSNQIYFEAQNMKETKQMKNKK